MKSWHRLSHPSICVPCSPTEVNRRSASMSKCCCDVTAPRRMHILNRDALNLNWNALWNILFLRPVDQYSRPANRHNSSHNSTINMITRNRPATHFSVTLTMKRHVYLLPPKLNHPDEIKVPPAHTHMLINSSCTVMHMPNDDKKRLPPERVHRITLSSRPAHMISIKWSLITERMK